MLETGTTRLTVAQAIVKWLMNQFIRIDGVETRICGGGFGIFGHGNVAGIGEALYAGIEATVNKAAAGNDAAFAFKTGFSARALIGLLGNDDFSFKVSPDGLAFFDAIRIDRTNGRPTLPQGAILGTLGGQACLC